MTGPKLGRMSVDLLLKGLSSVQHKICSVTINLVLNLYLVMCTASNEQDHGYKIVNTLREI